MTKTWICAALIIGFVAVAGLDPAVIAQQTGITRNILQRVDSPGSTTHEIVMASVEIAPGASAGRHRHHGTEVGYVIEGSIVIEHAGRPAATKKAGEYFNIDPAAVHDARNPDKTPTKLLAIYVVEKGKPLAEPVK